MIDIGPHSDVSGLAWGVQWRPRLTPTAAVANAGDVPALLYGEYLSGTVSEIKLGNVALQNVQTLDDHTISAVIPVASLSTGAVYTLTAKIDGRSLTLPDAFTVLPAEPETPFRIMIAMVCDSTLKSECFKLFNDLELAVSRNPALRIVVLWDGPADGDSAYYLVQPDVNLGQPASYTDKVNRFPLGEIDGGDWRELASFAAFAQARYPGQYKFLSLVGHGGGWAPALYAAQPRGYPSGGLGGMLWDQSTNHTINTRDLALALDALGAGYGMDVIYLDACLMGSLEVAAEIAPYADYFILHENLTWAIYPYADYLDIVASGPTPYELASHIAEVLAASWPTIGHPAQVAVIKGAELEALLEKVDQLAGALLDNLVTLRPVIAENLKAAMHVDDASDYTIDDQDVVFDLYDLAELLTQDTRLYTTTIRLAAQKVMDTIPTTVALNYTLPGRPWPNMPEYWDMARLHGLSIYFPLPDEWRRPFYNAAALPIFAGTTRWDDLIAAWYAGVPPVKPPTPCKGAECGFHTTAIGLWVDTSGITAQTGLVYIPVKLDGMAAADLLNGMQITVLSSDLGVAYPAADQTPRLGGLFPQGSRLTTTPLANGWGVVLNAPDPQIPVTGGGMVIELPFYFGATDGCTALTFGDHLLANTNAVYLHHVALGDSLCRGVNGDVQVWPYQEFRSVLHPDVSVSIMGISGSYTAEKQADGAFVVADLPAGDYQMIVYSPLFVDAVRQITVSSGKTTLAESGLWAGDIDDDQDVDDRDYYLVAAAIYPVNAPYFDVNGDGKVDIVDTTLVNRNIGRVNMPETDSERQSLLRLASALNLTNSTCRGNIHLQALGAGQFDLYVDQSCGKIHSLGLRLEATVASVEALTPGAYVNQQQDGSTFYLVAAPDEGAYWLNNQAVLRLKMAGDVSGTPAVENYNVLSDYFTLYLPMTRK